MRQRTLFFEMLFRWAFTFFVLAAFLGWGAYVFEKMCELMEKPDAVNVFQSFGLGVVSTTLVAVLMLTVQYHFRKRPHESTTEEK